jgi:hypothetical protein
VINCQCDVYQQLGLRLSTAACSCDCGISISVQCIAGVQTLDHRCDSGPVRTRPSWAECGVFSLTGLPDKEALQASLTTAHAVGAVGTPQVNLKNLLTCMSLALDRSRTARFPNLLRLRAVSQPVLATTFIVLVRNHAPQYAAVQKRVLCFANKGTAARLCRFIAIHCFGAQPPIGIRPLTP